MNKELIFILWAKWHVANFDMSMWCRFGWHMSSSNLINLMTLIWNLPLNFDVAFCNWLDKFLPPTVGLLKFPIGTRTYEFINSNTSVARSFPSYQLILFPNWVLWVWKKNYIFYIYKKYCYLIFLVYHERYFLSTKELQLKSYIHK